MAGRGSWFLGLEGQQEEVVPPVLGVRACPQRQGGHRRRRNAGQRSGRRHAGFSLLPVQSPPEIFHRWSSSWQGKLGHKHFSPSWYTAELGQSPTPTATQGKVWNRAGLCRKPLPRMLMSVSYLVGLFGGSCFFGGAYHPMRSCPDNTHKMSSDVIRWWLFFNY